MKVLHVLRSNRFSGAENVVCQIISLCKNDDIAFVYTSCNGQIKDALKERNIHFEPMEKLCISELRRVIKQVKPDIIHAHDMYASFISALTCGRIPLISHIHNNNFDARGLSIKSALYYLAAKKAKHIFWVSQSSYEGYAFHNAFKQKSTVLYNIIDTDALKQKMSLDKNTYDYDVVYLGRLTPPKNPQRLIGVIEKAVMKCPEIKVAIIGIGDLEAAAKQMAKDKALLDNITFLGFMDNPYKVLHDAKVMVMTSRFEGTPMCALEAMALGVPIVSTPTDGLRELVENNVNGFLSDDDTVLVNYIIELVNNEKLYQRLSDYQKVLSTKYNDQKNYKDTLLNIYNLQEQS